MGAGWGEAEMHFNRVFSGCAGVFSCSFCLCLYVEPSAVGGQVGGGGALNRSIQPKS